MKASTSSREQGGSEASLRRRAAEKAARAMASSAMLAVVPGAEGRQLLNSLFVFIDRVTASLLVSWMGSECMWVECGRRMASLGQACLRKSRYGQTSDKQIRCNHETQTQDSGPSTTCKPRNEPYEIIRLIYLCSSWPTCCLILAKNAHGHPNSHSSVRSC